MILSFAAISILYRDGFFYRGGRSLESLALQDVCFRYEEQPILDHVHFSIQEGEFVSLIGPSGCGKSTIFRLITGLSQAQSGQVTVAKQPVGYMPQQDLLLPWRTVLQNTLLPLECQRIPKKRAEEQSKALLEEFGLGAYMHKKPKDLSGGMRQRVAFIRALNASQDVLLLDEPFSALDALTKMELQDWLYIQAKKWRKTILFITHDVDEALYLSDRILTVQQTPIHTLHETIVPMEHPRQRSDLASKEVQDVKQQLIHMLQQGRQQI